MSAVVDSSVLVALLVDTGQYGEWAESTIEGHVLCAPQLVLVETANVLRRLELGKQITAREAEASQNDLMQLDLELYPYEPFWERVWELRRSVTCYDAWYVAVAEALGYPLVTLDTRLSRASGPNCAFLTPTRR